MTETGAYHMRIIVCRMLRGNDSRGSRASRISRVYSWVVEEQVALDVRFF